MAEMPMAMPQEQEESDDKEGMKSPSDPQSLILSVNDGLSKLQALMSKSQVSPAAKQAIDQALASFQSGVESMLGKGQEPAMAGATSMEAGANPRAVPVG